MKRSWTVFRLMFCVAILLTMANPAVMVAGKAGATTEAITDTIPEGLIAVEDIPAPPAGGPRPTITLSPDHGYAGQSIVVSGQGALPYPGVRIAWLTGDATLTAAVVDLQQSQSYSATITVPNDAAPGPAQVCAAVTGTAQAEFACADFTIDTPPPGSVRGRIPLPTTVYRGARSRQFINASFVLFDPQGVETASAPVEEDGSFTMTEVAPGTYEGVLTGTTSTLVAPTRVEVLPGGVTSITPFVLEPLQCVAEPDVAVSMTTATPNGPPVGSTASFGVYVALGAGGTPVNVTFRSVLQIRTGSEVGSVEFRIVRPDGSEIFIGSDATPPYEATYNVSLLPEGFSTLKVTPILTSGGCAEVDHRSIEVIANPMDDPLIRDGHVSWNSSRQRYDFRGAIPEVGGLLPVVYPDPPPDLPLIGRRENRLDAGVRIEGSLELDGDVRMRVLRADALARLFGFDVLNRSQDLLPSGAERVFVNAGDFRRLGISLGRHELVSFDEEVQVYRGVIFGDWGVVTVNASVSVGIGGEVILEGAIRPLVPALDATLTPKGGPRLSLSIWVDILLGVASAGADATAQMTLGLPLRLNTEHAPPVWLDDPCLNINVTLRAWARVNLLFWKKRWRLDPWNLVAYSQPSGCGRGLMRQAAAETIDPPRVMAAPSVASGPGGRMLSVYIQDTTPHVITPTMQVMVRFWDSTVGGWGKATPLTDGSHAVQDPAAAFVGPNGHALVVWTENTMSLEEDDRAGDNLAKILARQEIFYAYWNGQVWSRPRQLTDDNLPDGRAAIAGDASGATLAWVRDIDGDIATRTDWRIAVTQWDAVEGDWGPVELFDASSAAFRRPSTAMRPTRGRIAPRSVTPVSVPSARSLQLDGSGGYVQIPYAQELNALDAITIEAWVKRSATRCETVVGNGWRTSYWLGFCTGPIRFYRGSGAPVDGSATIPANQWTHVAVTYDGQTRRFYVNGVLDRETSADAGPIMPAQLPLYIGADRDGGCTDPQLCAFQGLIDEVRIWSVVRTQTEIQSSLYQALDEKQPGLLAVWHFDGDAKDAVGGRHGTLVGNATFSSEGFPAVTPSGAMNAQVSVARVGGRVALAWTVDLDGDIKTNGDRRIAIAERTANGWWLDAPQDLPAGADSPSISLGPQQEINLAFLVRGKDGDGVTDTGIGNQAVLWTARRDPNGGWQATLMRDERGQPVRAERPLLSTNPKDETLLLFRRFGNVGTNGAFGQLALSQRTAGGRFGAPLYLTDEPRQHWQPALALNRATDEAVILNVSRPAIGTPGASARSVAQFPAPASTSARPQVRSMTLTVGDDPVESLSVEPGADPALDPTLALSQQHALPSSTVVVTATVRNLGRASASGLSVIFYAGTPVTGTLLTAIPVPGSLEFNQSHQVSYEVTAAGGEQPISAKVTTGDEDINPDNNRAAAALGELPPPTFVTVGVSTRHPDALEVTWLPPEVEGVAGYRILRSETSGGPYDLVGEASGTVYTDVLLQWGRSYFFVVQAYGATGVRSELSEEAIGTLPALGRVYLPLMRR